MRVYVVTNRKCSVGVTGLSITYIIEYFFSYYKNTISHGDMCGAPATLSHCEMCTKKTVRCDVQRGHIRYINRGVSR